jgi:hypothetical protein
MNKKLLKEINHFRKLTNLPLIVEDTRGETTVFKELLNIIFKNEAKYAAEGMFTYANKRGGKVILKPEVAKNILEKDVTTITRVEELEAYQALHDNMVNTFGARTIASAMNIELRKITNPITRETTKRFILEKNFNKTRNLITTELDQLEHVASNQAQDMGKTNLPKLEIQPQLKGLTGKNAQAVRDLVEDIEKASTTVEGRIKLYDALDEARLRSSRRSIDAEMDRMNADSKQKVQPYVEDADIAEQNARKAKAEAESKIQNDKKTLSRMQKWKEGFVVAAAGAKALVVIIGAILSMLILGIVIMGVVWVYKNVIKPLGSWLTGGTSNLGGSLPSSSHNSWSEPGKNDGGSKPSNNNNDEGSLDHPDQLPNH